MLSLIEENVCFVLNIQNYFLSAHDIFWLIIYSLLSCNFQRTYSNILFYLVDTDAVCFVSSNIYLPIFRTVTQWIWVLNTILLSEESGQFPVAGTQQSNTVIDVVAHYQLVLAHRGDATWVPQQGTDVSLEQVEPAIQLANGGCTRVRDVNHAVGGWGEPIGTLEVLGCPTIAKLVKNLSLLRYHFQPRITTVRHDEIITAWSNAIHIFLYTQLFASDKLVVVHRDELNLL